MSNSTGWARSTLKKAGFLQSTEYAYLKIIKLGLEVLSQNHEKIDSTNYFSVS